MSQTQQSLLRQISQLAAAQDQAVEVGFRACQVREDRHSAEVLQRAFDAEQRSELQVRGSRPATPSATTPSRSASTSWKTRYAVAGLEITSLNVGINQQRWSEPHLVDI